MLYLLTPRDPSHPRWHHSKITVPVQVHASSIAAARDLAVMHLAHGPDSAGSSAWLDAALCEATPLAELRGDTAIIGEYGLVLPGA